MEQKITSPAIKGVIISLILILFSLVIYFLGLTENQPLGWVSLLPYLVGIIWGCMIFAKQMNGNVTFGNVFAHGFKTTAAVTAIMVVYVVIYIKLINTGMVNMALDKARQNMESKGSLSASQIDDAIAMTQKFFIPFAIGGQLLMNLILGVIFSLIGAAVAKKNPDYNPIEK